MNCCRRPGCLPVALGVVGLLLCLLSPIFLAIVAGLALVIFLFMAIFYPFFF